MSGLDGPRENFQTGNCIKVSNCLCVGRDVDCCEMSEGKKIVCTQKERKK